MRPLRPLGLLALLPFLAACGDFSTRLLPQGRSAATVAAPVVSPRPPPPGARTADALDTTTEAERQAARAAPAAAGAALGRVVVALGAPTEPGFWLRSALVTAPGRGRVELSPGNAVAVDLLPGTGAAQLSLAAYRALGIGLTDLPQVTVYRQ